MLVDLWESNEWMIPMTANHGFPEMVSPEWFENRKADTSMRINLNEVKDIKKELTREKVKEDFSEKLRSEIISGFQDYYEKLNKISVSFSSKVVEFEPILRVIEKCEKARDDELPPLKPMSNQLIEYMSLNDI